MTASYANLCASDAAAKMLDAALAGETKEQISAILEGIVSQNARSISEAHLIRDAALALLGWQQ